MRKEIKELEIEDKKHKIEVDIIEKSDKDDIILMYKSWLLLSKKLNKFGCRKVNFPEISELIYCLVFDSWRVNNTPELEHSSFDCYNPKNKTRIQVKATSVEDDLTSFGPKSIWDELIFMDFFSEGKYDGTFTVYKIPNEKIYNFKVNKNETFKDKQQTGQRPRFHVKKGLIRPLKIKPIGKYNLFEL